MIARGHTGFIGLGVSIKYVLFFERLDDVVEPANITSRSPNVFDGINTRVVAARATIAAVGQEAT